MVAAHHLNRCLACGAATFNTYCSACAPRIVKLLIAPRREARAYQHSGKSPRTHLADGRVRCPECGAKPCRELDCARCNGKGWIR